MDEQKLPKKMDPAPSGLPSHKTNAGSAKVRERTDAQKDGERKPEGSDTQKHADAEERADAQERADAKEHADALLDDALDMTFPASDPVAFTSPPAKESKSRQRR